MRVKDIRKMLMIGNTTMNKETEEKLKEIGFEKLPDSLKEFGMLIWEINYSYEVYIEYPRGKEERRYNEGVEKVIELIGEGFFGEVYKVSSNVYIIHLATGFDEDYYVEVVDKEEAELIGFLRITEGFLYCGNRDEVSETITKLVRITPVFIKVF